MVEAAGMREGETGCYTGCASCPSVRAIDWLADLEPAAYAGDPNVVEVRFKGRRTDFYATGGLADLAIGDAVIVEADRGIDLGFVHLRGELVRLRLRADSGTDPSVLPKIVRRAGEEDLAKYRSNREKEAEAFTIGREMVARYGLAMKIADAEWQFDRNKVTLYFTAECRVDFRKLVREMAGRFRTRVELRQIGARDEAGRIGGTGSCGRELCCASWLHGFKPVAMQTAKTQDLPLNPQRLSGQCGRLKCCLNYELELYVEAMKHLPRVGKLIVTEKGKGLVCKVDIFRSVVWVKFKDGGIESFASEALRPA